MIHGKTRAFGVHESWREKPIFRSTHLADGEMRKPTLDTPALKVHALEISLWALGESKSPSTPPLPSLPELKVRRAEWNYSVLKVSEAKQPELTALVRAQPRKEGRANSPSLPTSVLIAN